MHNVCLQSGSGTATTNGYHNAFNFNNVDNYDSVGSIVQNLANIQLENNTISKVIQD